MIRLACLLGIAALAVVAATQTSQPAAEQPQPQSPPEPQPLTAQSRHLGNLGMDVPRFHVRFSLN